MNTVLRKILSASLALSMTAVLLSGCTGGSPASSSQAGDSAQDGTESSAQIDADLSVGLDENGYYSGFSALDYVTLPEDYQSMEIDEEETAISDEAIDAIVLKLVSEFATSQAVRNRAVEDGDTVNIDYVGSVDGVEFSGGNTGGQGTEVIIGTTQYIDDFLEQLIGHMPGETFDVNVTFPDPYPNNTDMSGKDAVFVTTINYITETTSPEFDDAFVKEHFEDTMGWTTSAEALEKIKEAWGKSITGAYLWEQLGDKAEISEIPAALEEGFKEQLKAAYTFQAQQYGFETVDEYLGNVESGLTFEKMLEENAEAFDSDVRDVLVLQAISEANNIKPTEEQMATYIITTIGSCNTEAIFEFYGREYISMLTREELAKQALMGDR